MHRQICKNFGGENVTMYTNYSYLWTSGSTFCSNETGRGSELQMRTDIVGYHAQALLYAFFIGILLLVGYRKL